MGKGKKNCKVVSGETPITIVAEHIMQNVLQVWRADLHRIRPKLGDEIHIFDLQSRLASTLISSEGLSAALYAGGVKYGRSTASYTTLCSEVSGYIDDFRHVKGVKDARKSDLFRLFKAFFEINKSGILEMEEYKGDEIVFTIDECSESSGLPNMGRKVCYFPCGCLTGFMSVVLDKNFVGMETKCVAKGDKICEFVLKSSD